MAAQDAVPLVSISVPVSLTAVAAAMDVMVAAADAAACLAMAAFWANCPGTRVTIADAAVAASVVDFQNCDIFASSAEVEVAVHVRSLDVPICSARFIPCFPTPRQVFALNAGMTSRLKHYS